MKLACVLFAMIFASVVFPVPGGPQKIIEVGSSLSIATRSGFPGANKCSCPTNSSNVRGRILSASGAPRCDRPGALIGEVSNKLITPPPQPRAVVSHSFHLAAKARVPHPSRLCEGWVVRCPNYHNPVLVPPVTHILDSRKKALCQLASYNNKLPATAAFKLSTGPGHQIVTFASAIAINSALNPAPSFPIITAQASTRSPSFTAVPPEPTAARRRIPRSFNSAISATSIAITGTRNTLPALARNAFWFHALTVPGVVSTPVAPKASADRMSVPRFPGSCNPAATRINAADPPLPNTSSDPNTGGIISAAIPCGVSVSTTLRNRSSVSRITSTPRGKPFGVPRRSPKNTVFNEAPLRKASSTRCSPSIATNPSLRRACPPKAARSCFTRAFALLEITLSPIRASYLCLLSARPRTILRHIR